MATPGISSSKDRRAVGDGTICLAKRATALTAKDGGDDTVSLAGRTTVLQGRRAPMGGAAVADEAAVEDEDAGNW